jgi:uncharacterized protein YjcR
MGICCSRISRDHNGALSLVSIVGARLNPLDLKAFKAKHMKQTKAPPRPTIRAEPTRCGARTRAGEPCKSRAMPNGRCRMHGGTSPGAPKGNRNAWKHGKYSAWTKALIAFEKAALLK